MSLLALQQSLRDHLLSGDSTIAGQIRGDPQAGMAVYHNAYRNQLVDCLRDTYEKVAAWLGDDAFEACARDHIAANPPTSWTLGDYGATFAATLSAFYPDDLEVAELAWLDWTLRRAFDDVDAEPVDAAELADVDWDSAAFTFVPTLRLTLVQTNCAAIWSALAGETMPPAAERLPEANTVRAWRAGLSPQFKTIPPVEARALRLAMAGLSFGEICMIAIDETDEDEAVRAAGNLLATWLADGLLREVR